MRPPFSIFFKALAFRSLIPEPASCWLRAQNLRSTGLSRRTKPNRWPTTAPGYDISSSLRLPGHVGAKSQVYASLRSAHGPLHGVREPQKFRPSTSLSGRTRIALSQELEDLDVGDVEVGPLVQVLVGVVPG